VRDLFKTIDALDITPDEVWTAVSYINDLGASSEAGLLAPGLGLEHFLDLRMDAEDKQRGVRTGTPRTIEGPFHVAGAPLSKERGSRSLSPATTMLSRPILMCTNPTLG
jgi:catechol 1,2-dioxygenase